MKKRLIAALTGTALVAGSGLMTQFAQADTASPTTAPSPSASAPADATRPTGRPGGRSGIGSRTAGQPTTHVAELAAKLGLPEETLSDALTTVREEAQAARPSTGSTDTDGGAAAHQERRGAMIEALAEELGIDEATLSAAMSELRAEAQATRTTRMQAKLDEAVSDGTLTQDEADAVRKANDSGVLSGRAGGHVPR